MAEQEKISGEARTGPQDAAACYAFLNEARCVALYGLKRDGRGFANDVLKQLRRVRPELSYCIVHPEADDIGGLPAVRSARQAAQAADCAIIAVKPAAARQAIADAGAAGIRRIWLAFNAAGQGNAEYARGMGLTVVKGCPLLYLDGTDVIHMFHRRLALFFRRI